MVQLQLREIYVEPKESMSLDQPNLSQCQRCSDSSADMHQLNETTSRFTIIDCSLMRSCFAGCTARQYTGHLANPHRGEDRRSLCVLCRVQCFICPASTDSFILCLIICVIARTFLSAPPTSIASEQLFSAAGQIYSDRRSSLLGENAEKLLFLAYNIRLFGAVLMYTVSNTDRTL